MAVSENFSKNLNLEVLSNKYLLKKQIFFLKIFKNSPLKF